MGVSTCAPFGVWACAVVTGVWFCDSYCLWLCPRASGDVWAALSHPLAGVGPGAVQREARGGLVSVRAGLCVCLGGTVVRSLRLDALADFAHVLSW